MNPAAIHDFLASHGKTPETAAAVGGLAAITYKTFQEAKEACCLMRLYGYAVSQAGCQFVVGPQMKGNPFVDQRVFQHVFQGHLCQDPEANYALYRKLITEELKELDDAVTAEEHLDALIDLIYVTIGAGIALGHDMQGAWNEVHRTNMAKLGPNGKPIIRPDGKVIKPADWRGPELRPFVGHDLQQFTSVEAQP